MDYDDYPRRYNPRPSESKGSKIIIILLLLINTSALGCLLFLNFTAQEQSEQQEKRLSMIEKKIDSLDRATPKQLTESSTTMQSSSEQHSESTASSQQTEPSISSESSVQTIPSSESIEQPASAEKTMTYTVQAGDTLSVIAEQNNMSLSELMNLNGLTDQTVLVGQVLSLR